MVLIVLLSVLQMELEEYSDRSVNGRAGPVNNPQDNLNFAGVSVNIRLHPCVDDLTALVMVNLRCAGVDIAYIRELCCIDTRAAELILGARAYPFKRKSFDRVEPYPPTYTHNFNILRRKYIWMDQINNNLPVELAHFPDLTEWTTAKYRRYLARKRAHMGPIMRIMIEYLVYFTGIDLEDATRVTGFNQRQLITYYNKVQQFYRTERMQ